ncbi:hypothetical protein COT75_02975 [Candidatus Beckwithbacteria bacterium CG10_big_fil_rev_8_21_14_0_10_34_10]|uniref:Uncharacterized protein n=1 Tax=Candidatus Beckwithbacteria bacterium CG10_big_fil_rev_8_21_14_0_10_34_10 TaxID=1974495 RepID=A0A2H0WBA1_9BACT|nr:MAG: hypothetical protein COT75_02975 [Candidatus Beckwithbacteria bacterium CG10_big_fil_rev_8_21_14_0_10_34_10]
MKKKILVVSHDAGGANILASLVKKNKGDFKWLLYLAGPAKKIFLEKKISIYAEALHLKNHRIEKILKLFQPDLVLTGSGGGSSLEIDFIKSAKKNNIKTACFLDHWINYRERFGYPGDWKMNLPDYIFVGDRWAYRIALKNGFPKKIILQIKNPYFEESLEQAKKVEQNNKKQHQNKKMRILYISEPIFQSALKKYRNSHYFGYTEYEVIKDLLKIIKSRSMGILLELKIRLHPAEKINKYSEMLKSERYKRIRKLVSISNPARNLLVQDCIWADIVIGSSSMALFIAFIVGKKVISYIPTNKQVFSFPQKEIKRINSRKELLKEINGDK